MTGIEEHRRGGVEWPLVRADEEYVQCPPTSLRHPSADQLLRRRMLTATISIATGQLRNSVAANTAANGESMSNSRPPARARTTRLHSIQFGRTIVRPPLHALVNCPPIHALARRAEGHIDW
jgi:hypothetical protein